MCIVRRFGDTGIDFIIEVIDEETVRVVIGIVVVQKEQC